MFKSSKTRTHDRLISITSHLCQPYDHPIPIWAFLYWSQKVSLERKKCFIPKQKGQLSSDENQATVRFLLLLLAAAVVTPVVASVVVAVAAVVASSLFIQLQSELCHLVGRGQQKQRDIFNSLQPQMQQKLDRKKKSGKIREGGKVSVSAEKKKKSMSWLLFIFKTRLKEPQRISAVLKIYREYQRWVNLPKEF